VCVCVQGAQKSLEWLRGGVDANAEFTQIEDAVMSLELTEQTSLSVTDLFLNARVRKPFFLSIALMFFQQLSGVNAVIFYTSQIFESAGFTADPNSPTMIVGAVLVVMTLLSCIVADVAGRRVLLLLSGALMTVSLAALGAYFFVTERYQVCLSVCLSVCPPSPPLDSIQVMVNVWRLRGNIIRTAPCWVV